MMQIFFANRKWACGVAPTVAAALFVLVQPRCGIALDTAGFCDSFEATKLVRKLGEAALQIREFVVPTEPW
jgi:hypothetical protein